MSASRRRLLHAAAVAGGAAPALLLAGGAVWGDLGANPIETVTHTSGDWTLRFLLLTLAVSPLRRRLGWRWLAPLRRTLGLTAFAWASLHFATWLVLDHFFHWESIAEDVLERRYVTVGFAAYVLLVPLAATSTRGMVRRLGRRWKPLHRLVYAAGVGGVLHFVWLAKADLREPLIHAGVLAVLLAERAWHALSRARP